MQSRRFAAALIVFIAAFSATSCIVSAEQTQADNACTPANDYYKYRTDKPKNAKFTEKVDGKDKEFFNMLGFPCKDTTAGKVTSGTCVASSKCEATKTDGQTPDQQQPGEYCASHPDICSGVGADQVPEPTTPKPDGAGGAPNVPQPGTGGSDPTKPTEPKPNGAETNPYLNGEIKPTPADDPNNPTNNPDSLTPTTNSFGNQLQQAQQSSGFLNTIENYFNPSDAFSPDSSGIGNFYGADSLTGQGSQTDFSGSPSLYDQAMNPMAQSTGFTGESTNAGESSSWFSSFTDSISSFGDTLSSAWGSVSDTVSSAYTSASNAVSSVGDYVAQTTGFEGSPVAEVTPNTIEQDGAPAVDNSPAATETQTDTNGPADTGADKTPSAQPFETYGLDKDPMAQLTQQNRDTLAEQAEYDPQVKGDQTRMQEDLKDFNQRMDDFNQRNAACGTSCSAETRAALQAEGNGLNSERDGLLKDVGNYNKLVSSDNFLSQLASKPDLSGFTGSGPTTDQANNVFNAEHAALTEIGQQNANSFWNQTETQSPALAADRDRIANNAFEAASNNVTPQMTREAVADMTRVQDSYDQRAIEQAQSRIYDLRDQIANTPSDPRVIDPLNGIVEYNPELNDLQRAQAAAEKEIQDANTRMETRDAVRTFIATNDKGDAVADTLLNNKSPVVQQALTDAIVKYQSEADKLVRFDSGESADGRLNNALRPFIGEANYDFSRAAYSGPVDRADSVIAQLVGQEPMSSEVQNQLDAYAGNHGPIFGAIYSAQDYLHQAASLENAQTNGFYPVTGAAAFLASSLVDPAVTVLGGSPAEQIQAPFNSTVQNIMNYGNGVAFTALNATMIASPFMSAAGTAERALVAFDGAASGGELSTLEKTVAARDSYYSAYQQAVDSGNVSAARTNFNQFEAANSAVERLGGEAVTPAARFTEGSNVSEVRPLASEGAASQVDAGLAQIATRNAEIGAVQAAAEEKLAPYTVTEAQMNELTRPLTAAETPLNSTERAALDRYNTAVQEYTNVQQQITDGTLSANSPLARGAVSDYLAAGTELRQAGLIERPGAISENQFGLDTVYRAETGEVLASRANAIASPEPYRIASSPVPEAPVVQQAPSIVPEAQPQSIFERGTQPIRNLFAGDNAPRPNNSFTQPSYDTRPQTFTQTLERQVSGIFRVAEPAPMNALTIPEARALDTFNSAMAEHSLPIASDVSAAGQAFITSQRANYLNGAITGLAAEGLHMRADGPIVRSNGDIVAAPLPIQIPGMAPYGITAPIEPMVRETAIAQNVAEPSRADQTAPVTTAVTDQPRPQSITAPQPRGLLPGETVSPQVALRNALSGLGILAGLINPTLAEAGKTNGSPSFNQCVAQMCLRPITGNFSYYDPRKGGINVDWSAVQGGMALTKSGEAVSMNRNTNIDEHMTIASQRYPINTIVQLCNGGSCTFVRVNDTGDFEKYGRIGDLMPGPARAIGFDIDKGVNVLTEIPLVALSGKDGNHQLLVNGIADGVLRDLNRGVPLTQALDNAAARSPNVFTYTVPTSNIAYVAAPLSKPGTLLASIAGEQTAPVTTVVSAPPTASITEAPMPKSGATLVQVAKQGGQPQIPGIDKIVYLSNLNAVPTTKWKNIVIHQTEGPGGQALALAQQQAARPGKTGASIYVETDGTVYWATSENASPSHIRANRTDSAYIPNATTRGQLSNQNSIGIEFAGNFPDVAKPLTDAQMKSGVALVEFLQERYGIRADNVYAHNWIDYKDERYNEGAQLAQQMRTIGYVPGQATSPTYTTAAQPTAPAQPAPDFETRLREAMAQENAKAAQNANKQELSVTQDLEKRLAEKNQQLIDEAGPAARATTRSFAPVPTWTPSSFAPAPITQPYASAAPRSPITVPSTEPAPLDISDIAVVPTQSPAQDITPTIPTTVQTPPVLVAGAVSVPAVNSINPELLQKRLSDTRDSLKNAQVQVDSLKKQIAPISQKIAEIQKLETLTESAEKNLAAMNVGRRLLDSLSVQPNPAQRATLRNAVAGASRLANNVTQLGDSGLGSDLRGYVNHMNWMSQPKNQTEASLQTARSSTVTLSNAAQRVITRANAKLEALDDPVELQKTRTGLAAELTAANKNLDSLKGIEQTTLSQMQVSPTIVVGEVAPAPETVANVEPAKTEVETPLIAETVAEAIEEPEPKLVRTPGEIDKLALPPDFAPSFTQFPYDLVGNPPQYTYPEPLSFKSIALANLGIATYLPGSMVAELQDVELGTKSVSFTKDELDAIQWGKMDKYAYDNLLRVLNPDPTLSTGYKPPVPNSGREPGSQLFTDIAENAGTRTPLSDAPIQSAEQTAPQTTPVTAPPARSVDEAQPTKVEKFFTRLASGQQVTQTIGKGISYTYQWAHDTIFGAAPSIQIGKLTSAPYESSVPAGSSANYVCASGETCARGNASGLFVQTAPGRSYVQVAVEAKSAVDTKSLLDGMKSKGVQPVMNAAGPFLTSTKDGSAVQDIAYNKGVSVGANVSSTGRDGLVITNADGKMVVANKQKLPADIFKQLGISTPEALKGRVLNIVGNDEDFKVFDTIMKDNQLSAMTNLLLVENGKLNPAVNDPYASRRLFIVMPDGTTGILSSVSNARTNDFAKVAEAMGAKYAVNLDTGFYDEATVHLQDGTPKYIGSAGGDSHAYGVIAIGVTPDNAPVQRTDTAPSSNVVAQPETVIAPTEQIAPQTIPVTAPVVTTEPSPTPNQPQVSETPNAVLPDTPQINGPKPNAAGALPAPDSATTPKPNTSGGDFSVTEVMPDGSIRALNPEVTTPGSNVPANRGGGGGGIVPPSDTTWRVYGDAPVPGPYLGASTGGLPWWTIGGLGGIAATLTTIASLQPDQSQQEQATQPDDQAAPQTTPVTSPATPSETKKDSDCGTRAITRDNMMRMLLGDPISEVDCVPTPSNILNNEPLPRIPDLKPVTPAPGTVGPGTVTRPPGTIPAGTVVRPPSGGTGGQGTGGTGFSAPTGSSGVNTGGTNAGQKSSVLSKLMSFLGGFLGGFGGAALQNSQQTQPIPPQPTPTIPGQQPQSNGTTTPVSVQITASPNPAHAGDDVRVSWASVSAVHCSTFTSQGTQLATGNPDSAVAFTAPATTTQYRVQCQNAAGQIATGSVTLIIR